MADIIQLLPDAIANQIAAGEVIQRPASVVKELMENSIDAGASEVKLIVKEAGKTLIQVIDNGCGMSETDARMCFERHATSKIREAKDLFAIRTMGFRGEAMASIAAIAHVDMRTKKHAQELGVQLIIEGSKVKSQEACQCNNGTSISVKNLFYNVPARRNFLKSNTVEMRHIVEEFQRIALAHPDIFFSLHHNGQEIFHLPSGNHRQRIVGMLGGQANKKLVPIDEKTDFLRIHGFVGKPEFAKRTRGDQYFFVNNRFIKSGYLHHSVVAAFEDLLQKDSHPLYFLYLEIDPKHIDINVHPTKQEIKFEDEKLIYNYLKVSVRHGLGQYSITPSLDFSQEGSFSASKNYGSRPTQSSFIQPSSMNDDVKSRSSSGNFSSKPSGSNLDATNQKNWQKLFEGIDDDFPTESAAPAADADESVIIASKWSDDNELDDAKKTFSKETKEPYQIQNTYIVSQIKSGYMLIDQQAAHERILYESYLAQMQTKQAATQKSLFPLNINLSTSDAALLNEIMEQVNALGFDIQPFGNNAFVIQGIPANLPAGQNEEKLLESLLEQYKSNIDLKLDINENIARSMARSAATKRGQSMTPTEMKELIDQLFATAAPFKSPRGRKCFVTYNMDDLEKEFL